MIFSSTCIYLYNTLDSPALVGYIIIIGGNTCSVILTHAGTTADVILTVRPAVTRETEAACNTVTHSNSNRNQCCQGDSVGVVVGLFYGWFCNTVNSLTLARDLFGEICDVLQIQKINTHKHNSGN